MQILFLSDTHGFHRKLKVLPPADMIIHAGDVTNRGEDHEAEDFIRWFSGLDYTYKVFVAGNHDFYFEEETIKRIQRTLPENAFYLCDSGIEIAGISLWGSPVTPLFFNWAFNRERGKEIRAHWKHIPENTNILITHGPPYGILDNIAGGTNAGCKDLLKKIRSVSPRYHLFGHIHESYGVRQIGHTTYINGSVMNEKYILSNPPVLFEY